MKTKSGRQNRFVSIISTPVRALGKAKDLYVKSMTRYADRLTYGVNVIPGTGQNPSLPKSFSVHSARSFDNDDLRELIRATSARSTGNRVDLDLYLQQQKNIGPVSGIGIRAVPRSSSVAMGRIDEDRPCCFFVQDAVNLKAELRYPRSRSHAVAGRTAV